MSVYLGSYLAHKVHTHTIGCSDIGGWSMVDMAKTVNIVTQVTMVGLLIGL